MDVFNTEMVSTKMSLQRLLTIPMLTIPMLSLQRLLTIPMLTIPMLSLQRLLTIPMLTIPMLSLQRLLTIPMVVIRFQSASPAFSAKIRASASRFNGQLLSLLNCPRTKGAKNGNKRDDSDDHEEADDGHAFVAADVIKMLIESEMQTKQAITARVIMDCKNGYQYCVRK